MIRFLQTQGPAKKIILSGILLVICGAMVIAFIPGGLGSDLLGAPGKGVVAKVDGGDVTVEQVRQATQQMVRQQMPQGSSANMSMLLPFFAQRAADQLITRQALVSEAEHLGLRVTPQEVQDDLQHGRYAATFFPGGNYIGKQEYVDMLARANLTPLIFEEEVRKELLLEKLRALVSGSASVSDDQIHQQFVKENSKVKFEYAVIKQDDLRKGLHPTDAELKAFYESHKAQYNNSIPEKRKVKYAVVDLGKIQSGIQTTHDDVQAYYDQHRDQYRVDQQAKVSHILIKTPLAGPGGKVDEKGVADAQHRAEDLLQQLKAGAKFEDLAKKYSEDPGSAKEGGSLGWIGKGRTVPDFEQRAFSQPKGQIGDLVKSSYGFHIIRVDDKQDAHMKTLDEVKGEIEPVLKQQKTHEAAQKQAEELLQQAKAKGFDAAAAGVNGVSLVTSDFFSRKDVV